jgi:hypothetical protein
VLPQIWRRSVDLRYHWQWTANSMQVKG